MAAIILYVLKIIGIVLLSLIGLVLLALLLVLFVPIRYSVSAFKNENDTDNYEIKAKVSFLLHIVNGRFLFPSDEKLRIRLLWFKLFPKKAKKEKIKPDRSKKKNEPDKTLKSNSNSYDYEDDEDLSDEDSPTIEELEKAAREHKFDNNAETVRKIAHTVNEEVADDNPTIRKFIDSIINFAKNIKEKIIGFVNKIKDIFNNIEYYLDLINSDLFRNSYALCKKEIIKLLKSIRPRKIKGLINFGDENCETVGKVFGFYSIIYPYVGKNLVLMPDFEKKIFTADIYLKGKITLFTVLVVAIKIYFNKDIKRTLKLFKKEK